MSVITQFHCDKCRERHGLEERKKVYDGLIQREESAEKPNQELIRKLKRNRQEVIEEIEKIDREHEPFNVDID